MFINEWFAPSSDLLLDMPWLDRTKDKEITLHSIKYFLLYALHKLFELADEDKKILFIEVKQFAVQYQSYSVGICVQRE